MLQADLGRVVMNHAGLRTGLFRQFVSAAPAISRMGLGCQALGDYDEKLLCLLAPSCLPPAMQHSAQMLK